MNKNKFFISRKINKQGNTLVEALVGATLLAICALMLVSGFTAALTLIKQGSDIKRKGLTASSIIEGAVISDSDILKSTIYNGSISYQIDSQLYTINGSFISVFEKTEKVGFVIFISNIQ